MKIEIIRDFTNHFDDHSQTTENGIEFWFARDLQYLLGYSEWRNFFKVITKSKISCEATDNAVSDHFVDVNKTIAMPKGATKEIQDIKKLERRVKSDNKKLGKNPDKLNE